MTSRERVLAALNHEQPDRVPVCLAYETPDEILRRYGKAPGCCPMRQDVHYARAQAPPPPAGIRERYFSDLHLPAGAWFDEWGVAHWRSTTGDSFSTVGPLRHAASEAEIEAFPWPDVGADPWAAGLPARVAALHAQGFAVQGTMSQTIFELAWAMYGMEHLLVDLVTDRDRVLCLFDRIVAKKKALACQYVRAGVDILRLGDDIATERGMMFSPELWRQTLKPRLAEVIAVAREIRPGIPVFYHSDGDVTDVIEDLIEVGVTILNPIQPEAMDPFAVKRSYGSRLTLWGTIGTHTQLPIYSPAEVRRVVRQHCAGLGKGGGFVISPTHSIERDVPWENIEAFYRAVEEQ